MGAMFSARATSLAGGSSMRQPRWMFNWASGWVTAASLSGIWKTDCDRWVSILCAICGNGARELKNLKYQSHCSECLSRRR